MFINYKDADGRTIELEVTEEVGNFYLASMEEEKRSERRETRRHTQLSEFTYEDVRYFDSGIDISRSYAESEGVKRVLGRLTARECSLIIKVHLEGYTYTEIGKAESKYPSTIMRETNCYRAKKTREDFAQKTRAGRSRGPGREASAKSIQKRGQNGLSFARRVTLPFSRFIWESILPHYLRSCTCFLLCAFLFFALSFHGFYSRFARVVTAYSQGL